jgi:hypothetical protein
VAVVEDADDQHRLIVRLAGRCHGQVAPGMSDCSVYQITGQVSTS